MCRERRDGKAWWNGVTIITLVTLGSLAALSQEPTPELTPVPQVVETRGEIASVASIVNMGADAVTTPTIVAVLPGGAEKRSRLAGRWGDKALVRVRGLGLAPATVEVWLDLGTTRTLAAQGVETLDPLVLLTKDVGEAARLATALTARFPAAQAEAGLNLVRRAVLDWAIDLEVRQKVKEVREATEREAREALAGIEP